MENVLMRLCRHTHGMTRKQAARKLGMSLNDYRELETAEATLTPKQARQLSKLYGIGASYFEEAARQLETLHTRAQVIQILKSDNERLNELMQEGYAMIHEAKMLHAERV